MKKLLFLVVTALFCVAASGQDIPSYRTRAPVKKTRPVPKTTPKTQSPKLISSYLFNIGFHTEFFNAVQSDDKGTLRKFDPAPVVGLGLKLPINASWSFLPEFNWVLPRSKTASNVLENLFMLRADWGYSALDWLLLRAGTGLMWLNQHGRGGKETLGNGNSQSTFYYPDENRSSVNNTLDLGIEALLDNWAIRLQTYTYFVFREERRQVSYSLFVTYYWDR